MGLKHTPSLFGCCLLGAWEDSAPPPLSVGSVWGPSVSIGPTDLGRSAGLFRSPRSFPSRRAEPHLCALLWPLLAPSGSSASTEGAEGEVGERAARPPVNQRCNPFGQGWRLILGASGEGHSHPPPQLLPHCWGPVESWGPVGGGGGERSRRVRWPQSAVGRGWAGFWAVCALLKYLE